MATTTNYGWTTPDDTALVKDGASAIRTLGSSVDTTTKALNPSTTLGDIEYRSSTANTNTRLGIGSTGQVLSVSGGVPAWSTISAGGMTLLSTTSLSGTSTTISSISGSYKNLQVIIRNCSFTSGSSLNISSNIANVTWVRTNNAVTYSRSQTSVLLNDGAVSLQSNTTSAFSMDIYDYAVTSAYKTFDLRLGYNTDRFVMASGYWQSNSALTSLTFAGDGTDTFNGGSEKMTIGYSEFIGPIIKAIQELSQLNNVLENKVNVLENKVNVLESKVNDLENKNNDLLSRIINIENRLSSNNN
jgi:hypothetical protein